MRDFVRDGLDAQDKILYLAGPATPAVPPPSSTRAGPRAAWRSSPSANSSPAGAGWSPPHCSAACAGPRPARARRASAPCGSPPT
ncbi:hypothetical protein [Streptomyces thioluteus]|uniref:hypothetical protein n=1 Tax=Streptomyces thioluteus TaxID=66431 RepID=UPI003CD05FDD